VNYLFKPRHCTLLFLLSSLVLVGCQSQPIVQVKPLKSAADRPANGLMVQQSPEYQEALRLYSHHDYSAALAGISSLLQKPQYQQSSTERAFLLHQQLLCRHAINPSLPVSEPLSPSVSLPRPAPLLASQADCGPRALLLLCPQFGVHTTLETLRRVAGTTGQGTTLQGLKRAAQAAGLKATGVQVDKVALSHVSLPAIAWYDSNHYVALLNVSDEQVTIHDPNQTKEETLSTNEFLGRTAGLLLTVSR